MKDQFHVWEYEFPGLLTPDKGGSHPVVLISHPDRCKRMKYINVLFCTSQRQNRQPYPYEVLLDAADGLDWETFCDCSMLWAVDASKLTHHRGQVTPERRNAIREKIRDVLLLSERD
jgi:mRNA-degrading endonuclease toxin of MazEF toxin-antitoxin module